MYSVLDDAALPAPGFPIRRSTGQRLFSTSPWLIAAVHVLLRLLVPRHPPCALTILTVSCPRLIQAWARLLPTPPRRGETLVDEHFHDARARKRARHMGRKCSA